MRSYAHQIRVYNHHNELLSFEPTELGDYIYIGNWLGSSIYDSYSGSLDAIAHEFTHGVSVSACDLGSDGYNYISGAIFESFSDIFGEFVEYQTLGSNDWVMELI